MQSGFGGVVDGAEDVGDDGGDGADLDDSATGADQEGREGLADVHDGEEVGFEGGARFGEGDVEGGHGVVCKSGPGGQSTDLCRRLCRDWKRNSLVPALLTR